MPVPSSLLTPTIVEHEPFSEPERFALAGFLAGYSGLTHEAYALDLRQYVTYCADHRLALFDVKRAHIEAFARQLEAVGRARATIARRLCTITGFYRYAEQEGLIPISPAVHVRRPRLDYESHATGLDRNEVGAMLVAAGLGDARDHALISLLALNGLRVSEATGADIERLGLERGHRTLRIVRKGGKCNSRHQASPSKRSSPSSNTAAASPASSAKPPTKNAPRSTKRSESARSTTQNATRSDSAPTPLLQQRVGGATQTVSTRDPWQGWLQAA